MELFFLIMVLDATGNNSETPLQNCKLASFIHATTEYYYHYGKSSTHCFFIFVSVLGYQVLKKVVEKETILASIDFFFLMFLFLN